MEQSPNSRYLNNSCSHVHVQLHWYIDSLIHAGRRYQKPHVPIKEMCSNTHIGAVDYASVPTAIEAAMEYRRTGGT